MDVPRLLVGLVASAAGAAAILVSVLQPASDRLHFALWAVSSAALALYAFLRGGRLRFVAAILLAAAIPFPLLLVAGAFDLFDTLQGNLAWPGLTVAGLALVALGQRAPAVAAWVAVGSQAVVLLLGVLILLRAELDYVLLYRVFDGILVAGCLGLALLPVRDAGTT